MANTAGQKCYLGDIEKQRADAQKKGRGVNPYLELQGT